MVGSLVNLRVSMMAAVLVGRSDGRKDSLLAKLKVDRMAGWTVGRKGDKTVGRKVVLKVVVMVL